MTGKETEEGNFHRLLHESWEDFLIFVLGDEPGG
jgi:hypothetical protein